MTIKSADNKQYFSNKIVDACIGLSTVKLGRAVTTKIANGLSNNLSKINSTLTQDEFTKVSDAAKEVLKLSGLKDKGVEVYHFNSEEYAKVIDTIKKDFNKGILKKLPENIKKEEIAFLLEQLKSGKNAAFMPRANKILMPNKDMALAFFHEAGHAMNKNVGVFGKLLEKSRSLSLLTGPIALIGIYKSNKKEGEKPKGPVDKVTTFIKDNAGKLTFLTLLPIVLEEGLASKKGNDYAKKLLDPSLAKKVAKANKYGFMTYLTLLAIFPTSIALGKKLQKVRQHKKTEKLNSKKEA